MPGSRRPSRAMCAMCATLLSVLAGCQATASSEKPVIEGGCAASRSSYLATMDMPSTARISYCDGGDAATGTMTTSVFPAGTQRVIASVAGYPDGAVVRLEAMPESGGAPVVLAIPRAGDHWQTTTIEIPPTLRAAAFRLRLTDASSETFGWAGLGFGDTLTSVGVMKPALALLLVIVAAHVWLCLLAWSLPQAWPASRRMVAAMLLMGAASAMVFFLQLGVALIGTTVAVLALMGPLAAMALRRPVSLAAFREPLQLGILALPSAVLAALVLWIGLYPFQWTGDTWGVPASRWLDLPIDNWLPKILGDMALRGVVDHPMIGDWLSSDRPPLQSGLYLIFRHLWPSSPGLLYQAMATWAQMLVLIPVAILVASVPSRTVRAAMIACVGLSALVVVNGLFVWPKLLAAAYCVIFHMALFSPGDQRRTSPIVAGGACALAMLSHGGALFALAGSAGAYALARRPGTATSLVRSIAFGAALYAPWIFYQRVVDPPGDRLLKWHFAGQIPIVPESLHAILVNAYTHVSLHAWISGRWANVQVLLTGTWQIFLDAWQLLRQGGQGDATALMVGSSFFHLSYSVWFFSPLLLLLAVWQLKGHRRSAFSLPDGLAMAFVIGILFWILVMFVPGSTIIHQGAYMAMLSLQLLVMMVCARTSRVLFFILAALNLSLALTLYAFDRSVEHMALYVAGTLALAVCFALACLYGQRDATCDNHGLPRSAAA